MSTYTFIDREKPITLVFAHAYAMDRRLWADQIDHLTDYNILTFDILCHGAHIPDCDSFSFENAAADLQAILAKEKIDRFILIGLSLGGYVIQEYKDSCGGGALGYVFVSCTPKFTTTYMPWELLSLEMSNIILPLMINPLMPLSAAMSSTVTPAGFLRTLGRISWDNSNLYKVWRALTEFLEPRTLSFNGDILVICGAYDNYGTIKLHMADWKMAYPQAQTVYVPMAGHLVNLDQPVIFNQLIQDFADRVAAKTLTEDPALIA